MNDKVLKCLFNESGLTSYDIAKRTKLTLENVDNSLEILQNRGQVCEIKLSEELLVFFITNLGKDYVKKEIRHFDSFIEDDFKYENVKKLKRKN